jgi:hypothetical protein
MKTKKFDCAEMKHRAARNIAQRLQGMSRKQELSHWYERYESMKKARARRSGAEESS